MPHWRAGGQGDVFAIRALEAAEHAGARRFVYLFVLHPHTPGLRHHMRKANVEAAVRASELDWTCPSGAPTTTSATA
ncbi:hypothetical protein [Streptomyces canus]|uniref:hypothetical protein n=1 Tax=Streptomyces canus TaxID=58343 RepID=UPI002E2FC1DC|nr:hypothetical protein [Streptomyces canus]